MEMERESSKKKLIKYLESGEKSKLSELFKMRGNPCSILFETLSVKEIGNVPHLNWSVLENIKHEKLEHTTAMNLAVFVHQNRPALLEELVTALKSRQEQLFGNHDVDALWRKEDSLGFNPVTLAVYLDNVVALGLIFSAGANILKLYSSPLDNSEIFSSTLLGISLAVGSSNVYHYLIGFRDLQKLWDTQGRRAVHIGVQYGRIDAVKILLLYDLEFLLDRNIDSNYFYRVREMCENLENRSTQQDASETFDGDHDYVSQQESEEGSIRNSEDEVISSNSIREEENNEERRHRSSSREDSSENDSNYLEMEDMLSFEREMENAGFEIYRDSSGNITARFTGAIEDILSETERLDEDIGSNLLHISCKYRQVEILEFLILFSKYIHNVDEFRSDGMTAAHICAKNNDFEALRILKDHGGADLNIRNDVLGMCPIHIACENGASDALKLLLSIGISPDMHDENSFVPLHYCATNDTSSDCIRILVQNGCSLDSRASDGETPLYTAISRWNLKVFWDLLNLGADPGIPHLDGTVAMGFIAANSMEELAKFCSFISKSELCKKSVELDIVVGENQQTCLHMAARVNHFDAIKALLEAGATPNVVDENGNTPLCLLLQNKSFKEQELIHSVKELLIYGADPNISNTDGTTPLHISSTKGYNSVVASLVSTRCNTEALEKSKTPLICATECNNLTCMEILIKNGANVDASDDAGLCPLLICSKYHFYEGFDLLIRNGADVTKTSKNGSTCLHLCAERPSFNVTRIIEMVSFSNVDLNVVDKDGETPIHAHISRRRVDGVRALIIAGCDLSMMSNDQTPLMAACDIGSIEIVRLLIQGGADVNQENNTHHTATFFFADDERTTIRILRLLIRHGAFLNHKDQDGDTVLHEAVLGDNATIARFLLQQGAHVNERNNLLETPLFQASKNGYLESVEVLLFKHGDSKAADIKIPNKDGDTPYAIAKRQGHTNVLQMLLKKMSVTLSSFSPISKVIFDVDSEFETHIRKDGSIHIREAICIICQEEFRSGDLVRWLPCKHSFHDSCILRWIGGESMLRSNVCPVCKQPIAPSSI